MTKTLTQIREKFIDFFIKNNHSHIPSSPLIPHNDPSLMFVNSGMVQFKNVFTGHENRSYKRATSSQKSVRAGGKHNDLDNVGYTARHHTFFEMLGNFSFGDYFKEEAIKYAWDLLVQELCLPADKLYVTVYHDDYEAANLWKKIAGLKDDKIIQISSLDNFWSMGETGPCGPCSEIFYDHGETIWGGPPGSAQQDGDRFVEIWNLVFMEFEQIDAHHRIALPNKSIDTGMGLERIAAVMQGVHNNYETDLFKDIIGYAQTLFESKAEEDKLCSYRVIADHLRSIAFLIADGIMPSNEGRGYVLRRIMRRAMRHSNMLGKNEPIIYKLLPKLIELMGSAYPELKRGEDFISNVLKQEEIRFFSTLDRGLKLLDDQVKKIPTGGMLEGQTAFKLYDTYGFPLDLTQDILKSKEISVDMDGFNINMEEQKQKARKAWAGSGENQENKIWFGIASEYGPTEFLGYATNDLEAKVLALVKDHTKCEQINKLKEEFIIITNQTPFYGESGGQMGDIGVIQGDHCKIRVVNTLKYQGSLHAHVCILEEGYVKLGDNIHLTIDFEHRKNLRVHHSATHILHAVLREVLGKHVAQKGSLVAYNHLRFDFSHTGALTNSELELVEEKVNKIILSNSKVSTSLMSTKEAVDSGAMALFGEKYDNEVRVVSIGALDGQGSYSFELCGGTHVARTGDIGSFKIISEHGVAAGVRRIEAVCGEFALKYAKENELLLGELSSILKANKKEIIAKINSLQVDNKELQKELSKLKLKRLEVSSDEIEKAINSDRGYKILCKIIDDCDIRTMREASTNLVAKYERLIALYISKATDNKLLIVIGISKDLKDELHAGKIVEKIANYLEGTGGGGISLAQGNGIALDKLAMIEAKLEELVGE